MSRPAHQQVAGTCTTGSCLVPAQLWSSVQWQESSVWPGRIPVILPEPGKERTVAVAEVGSEHVNSLKILLVGFQAPISATPSPW